MTTRPFSQEPSSDSACGRQHEGVVSLVPGSNARICHKNRQGSLHGFRWLVDQWRAELVDECPLTKRHHVKWNAAMAARVIRVADVRYVIAWRKMAWSANDPDGRARPRCTTTCDTSVWKPSGNNVSLNVSGTRRVALPVPRAGQRRHGLQRSVSHPHAARGEGQDSETWVNDHAQRIWKRNEERCQQLAWRHDRHN